MDNILELFYDQPRGIQAQDSPFVKTARIRSDNLKRLHDSLTDEQKRFLEAYFDADAEMEEMTSFNRFRYAFHFGAQFMAEIIEGKKELLE